LLEQQGADAAALAELELLAREARDSPQLLAHLAGQLAIAGRDDEADEVLSAGLAMSPADAGLHKQLARLRWQRGAELAAMRPIEDAIKRQPHALHLRLVAADLLRSAGATGRALELLEGGLQLAPDSAAFLTSIGVLLEGQDRVDEALVRLREARRRAPQSVAAQRNLVPALLRSGAAQEALALCDGLLVRFPLDQLLIAQRATALRVLADPEYRRLYDYQRLVKSYTLRPTAPFDGIEAFNAAFARELAGMHRGVRHPLEQSLRGGSQTERNLPRDNPVIAAFFGMLDAPIREYIGGLGADSTHPLDRRRGNGYRISGSWSVRLLAGGFHIDHVHPRGWLSSAYYVDLPDVSDADSRAGWLKFGEAPMRIPGCGPEHFVRPAAGMLVLFPSYLWHGTVPFATGRPRLTAAFDVVPA
jgi:tetratricopeptide (TPR) repeat protein